MPKNIAIIGCGHWGKNLIRCFSSLEALKGIFDCNSVLVRSHLKKYPDLRGYESLEEIWQDGEIDGVVVATPVESHFSIAMAALMSGKHIFVEKPMTVNVEQALNLVTAADSLDKVCLVGHVLEYHPAVKKMRDMVDSGVIGQVKEAYSHRLAPGKIRQFENVWWSFSPHDILLICNTIKQTVVDTQSWHTSYVQTGVADTTLTRLLFENGIFTHIYCSWTHPFKEQRFVITGSEGAIEFCDSRKDDKLVWYPMQLTTNIKSGNYNVVEFEDQEPLMLECQDFLHCIKTNSRPVSSGQDGLMVVRILTQAITEERHA